MLAVSQVNARGEPKGGTDLGHESDVTIECAHMEWRITKSRYADCTSRHIGGSILERAAVPRAKANVGVETFESIAHTQLRPANDVPEEVE